MYAQITIIGNVGNEPEMRYTPSGTPVCNFNVAVNRSWRNAEGEQQQKTTWFRIQAWQRQAEICAEYVKKGDRILVVSENIESGAWIDRDGNAQSNIQLVPRTVRFLTPKSEHPGDIVADEAGSSSTSDDNPF
ncbi:MAG: single-stranded DNA-binding protein [Caldilineaceae bacterium]